MSQKIWWTSIPILLLLVLFANFTIASGVDQSNNYPTVSIDFEDLSAVSVGGTFTVSVVVSSLKGHNLYGFDIEFRWDTQVVKYVSHDVKVPIEAYPEGVLHHPILEVRNHVDIETGTCWLVYASLAPAEPFNEDGVFFTITFVLLQESDNPFVLDHVILASHNGEIIPINNLKNFESLIGGTASSYEMTEARKKRCEMWLEWWITITQNFPKRRCVTG